MPAGHICLYSFLQNRRQSKVLQSIGNQFYRTSVDVLLQQKHFTYIPYFFEVCYCNECFKCQKLAVNIDVAVGMNIYTTAPPTSPQERKYCYLKTFNEFTLLLMHPLKSTAWENHVFSVVLWLLKRENAESTVLLRSGERPIYVLVGIWRTNS